MNPNRPLSNFQGAVYQYTYNAKKASGVCLQTITDYSPFGVTLDGRTMQGNGYRYGFNGYESDDEVKGNGNSYTTQFRQYDPRLGRWLTKDPVFKPQESPFALNGNNPVLIIDPNGADSTKVGGAWFWKVEKGDTYYSVGKRTGTDYQELQKINSQDAKSLKVGSLLSLRKAKTPTNSNQPTNNSSSKTSIPNWVWDMVEEIPNTELSLSALAIEKLGGLDKAKKLLESGKFQVKYKGETKTWSINFNGNQHVDAKLVKSSKVSAMNINATKTTALKVVKTGGVILNFIGIAVTAHQGYTEITTKGSISVETGADAFFGVVGFCGLVGTAVDASYFLLKPTVQWVHGAAIESGATLDHYGNVSYEEMWELFKSGW
jgi:RHS repeat-associated protein